MPSLTDTLERCCIWYELGKTWPFQQCLLKQQNFAQLLDTWTWKSFFMQNIHNNKSYSAPFTYCNIWIKWCSFYTNHSQLYTVASITDNSLPCCYSAFCKNTKAGASRGSGIDTCRTLVTDTASKCWEIISSSADIVLIDNDFALIYESMI